MEYLPGISLLGFYLLIGYFIWKSFQVNRIHTALALTLLLGLVLRIYVASDVYLHEWDERYHALVAKNMLSNPLAPKLYINAVLPYDYRDWSGNHIWLHKQPLTFWIITFSLKIFGNIAIAVRIPSIIFSTLGIWLTFLIGKEFFGKKVAAIAAFLFAINGFIIEITGGRITTDHVDVCFLFFIQLGILFSIYSVQKTKKSLYLVLSGICTGAALLVKWLPGLIVIGFYFFYALTNSKRPFSIIILNSFIMLGITLLIALPWQIYIHYAFPLEATFESTYNVKHFFEGLEGHGKPFYYHIDKIRILYGELVYLPLIWFPVLVYKKKYWQKIPLLVWLFVPLIFFSIAATKLPAYTLFCAPAIMIIIAYFFRFVILYKRTYLKTKWLFSLISLLLIALPLRYSIERIKPFKYSIEKPTWLKEIQQIQETTNNNRAIYFGMSHPIEAMFYKNIIAYSAIPDEKTLSRLKKEGYKIYLKKGEQIEKYQE